MSLPPHILWSWRAAWPGVLLTCLAGAVLLIFPPGNALRRWSYDLLAVLKPSVRAEEVVLVYIDDLSHTKLDQPYDAPWNRDLDARLVKRLRTFGAKAIGFDVVFDKPGGSAASDAAFAGAIREHGQVVLAATLARGDYFGLASEIQLTLPITNLAAAAQGWGFAELPVDADDMVRGHYAGTEEIPSLSWRMAGMLGAPVTRQPGAQPSERWMQYYDAGGAIPGVSYFKVLEDSDAVLAEFFRGKIVIVGAGSKSGYTGKRKDQFRNPHTWLTGRFSPGAEVHATALLNLLRGDWLRRPVWWEELGLVLGVGFAFPMLLVLRRPTVVMALVVAGILLVFLASWLWVALANVWCAWLIVVLVQVPVAVMWAFTKGVENRGIAATGAETQEFRQNAGEAATRPEIADYELLEPIGRGAYGEVWRARSVTGVMRAIKLVHRRGFAADRQFDREFQGLVNFEPVSRMHEGLVQVLHVGRNDTAGFFYYVMELADATDGGATRGPGISVAYVARTLATITSLRQPMPARDCLRLALELTAALAFLHERGLVHRDIKPANLIFVKGRLKLADIGLVAETGEARTFVGTEGYISPEGPGTPAADVFSTGRVLYEMLTGLESRWFPEQPTPVPDAEEPEMWHALFAVVQRACASDTERRYATAREMWRDLEATRVGRD